MWLTTLLVAAVLVSELPRLLAACCAPAGATGLGTAWFVNDFAQYESAMRQGAEQAGWLVHDPFTAEPHAPTLMFPLYVAVGKVAATMGVPPPMLEHGLELVARVLLVLALWRFCRAFAGEPRAIAGEPRAIASERTATRWAMGLALFGSGFELLAALAGSGYTGNWSYEMNGFGLLFAAPHVPLAMAATLELARELLRPRPAPSVGSLASGRSVGRPASGPSVGWPGRGLSVGWPGPGLTVGWLAKVALLSATVALLHPFHAPVLLGAVMLVGFAYLRSGRGVANLAGGLVAGIAALPVLLPTVLTFSFEPFWVTTYSLQNQLPSPAPHELLVDLGPTLVLALVGAVVFRSRVAPFGLLVWLLLELIAMYIPVPYQRRLGFGIQPTLAVIAANSLVGLCALVRARRAAALRLAVVGLAGSGTLLVLAGVVASGFRNAPLPVYRSTTDLDAAAAWLDRQARSGDVILADWDTSNYLAARTPARVFGGHPVATLHPDDKRLAIATVFSHASSLVIARDLGAQWLVYGPAEADLPAPPDPAFQSGPVRVYHT